MEEQAIDEEGIWKTLEKALRGAAEGLSQTRITEGENLKEDLISKLDGMLESVAFIEERSPQIIAEYLSLIHIYREICILFQGCAFHTACHRLPPGFNPLPRLADRTDSRISA